MLSWFREFPTGQVFRGLGGLGLIVIKGLGISQESRELVCLVLNWFGELLVGAGSGGLHSPVLSWFREFPIGPWSGGVTGAACTDVAQKACSQMDVQGISSSCDELGHQAPGWPGFWWTQLPWVLLG